jgi:hypothetical protein
MPSDADFIRSQIESLTSPGQQPATVIGRIVARCWPGGSADRVEPVAVSWVRRWGPGRQIAILPVCTCAAGRCAACN